MTSSITISKISKALKLAFVLFLLQSSGSIFANVIKTSQASGSFNSASTWSTVGVGGTIKYIVKAGDNVSINANSIGNDTIVVEGTLTFSNNITMSMNSTGTILIKSGGVITGGSSNTKITWNSGSTGVISGPWSGSNTQTGPSFANISTLAFVTMITPLPITIIDYTAELQNNKVKIQWSTTSEINTKNFTVQRSVDGIVWSNIATLNAAGNSNTLNTYTYFDAQPKNGQNYYRFIERDLNNNQSVSDILFVNYTSTSRQYTANIYPNPCNAIVNIALEGVESNDVVITVTNSFGQVVSTVTENTFGVYSIDTQNMNEGIYIITIQTGTENIAQQISVKH
ncbi:MAG: T9SS type A sorting domain-containing protein [Bacteroidota bacterium]